MKTSNNLIGRYWKRLTNASATKYVVVLLFAVIWMLIFDRYNVISQYNVSQEVEQLKQDEDHYRKAIEDLDYEREQLFNDKEEMERFAREKYQMKKRNEDVFVIVEE